MRFNLSLGFFLCLAGLCGIAFSQTPAADNGPPKRSSKACSEIARTSRRPVRATTSLEADAMQVQPPGGVGAATTNISNESFSLGVLMGAVMGALATAPMAQSQALSWKTLQPGIEYALVSAPEHGALSSDAHIHVVRIDPAKAPVEAIMAGAEDGRAHTAAEWCRKRNLAVAINMGMYREDRRTNSGHAHARGYVNNARWVSAYKSALGLGALKGGGPPALLADLDMPDEKSRLSTYGTVVQNLRLIRSPGRGVWGQQDRRWSEAAVATDKERRVLFIFSRYPYSMKELNDILLSLPLGITAAMHVEGGPEASLSIHAGGVDLDLNGSYETGFNENDAEQRQWPIPNVLGARASRAR
jgi:hypothetical protein